MKVISIFKKGKMNDFSHYWSISLLNAVFKICNKEINESLRNISQVISLEGQAGFRKGTSCIDEVLYSK